MREKTFIQFVVLMCLLTFSASASDDLVMDKTEVSIGAFAIFAQETGFVSQAEKHGGMVYETGWARKPGWNWRTPYGVAGDNNAPAVHITFAEAEQYCHWAGKRLPTRTEWIKAGYTESRANPPDGFERGKTYPYPTGNSPQGANCLSECGAEKSLQNKKKDFSPVLYRGAGHAPTGITRPGVNGLYDMGANVWEWARISDTRISDTRISDTGISKYSGEQATMGGSWWYGKRQMRADYGATKPHDMAAVYIGFRCISDAAGQHN